MTPNAFFGKFKNLIGKFNVILTKETKFIKTGDKIFGNFNKN